MEERLSLLPSLYEHFIFDRCHLDDLGKRHAETGMTASSSAQKKWLSHAPYATASATSCLATPETKEACLSYRSAQRSSDGFKFYNF
jgi:hypothetical protein